MTNPTRTRAEIQAEIEKLQAEQNDAWPNEGERVYMSATFRKPCDIPGSCFVVIHPKELPSCGEIVPYNSLIPAADLIPREEHERALAEAVNPDSAVACLISHFKNGEVGPTKLVIPWDDFSGKYRVTVERVEGAELEEPTQHVDHEANAASGEIETEHADGEGWLSFYFTCVICGHKQVYVCPLPCQHVECIKCGASVEVPSPESEADRD